MVIKVRGLLTWFGLIVVTVFLSLACASVAAPGVGAGASGRLVGSDPAVKPAWVDTVGTVKKNGSFYFVGRAHGIDSRDKAENAAFSDALTQISHHFGVSIASTVTDSQEEKNGTYSYNIGVRNTITGAPITLEHFAVAGRYTETWERDATEYDSFVLIGVPEAECRKIALELKGVAAWGIAATAINAEQLALLGPAYAKTKKLTLAPQKTLFQQNASLDELAASSDAAYFIAIDATATPPVQEGKAFFTTVTVTVRLLSLTQGKELDSITESLKWGEYTASAATEKGVKKAVQKILGSGETAR